MDTQRIVITYDDWFPVYEYDFAEPQDIEPVQVDVDHATLERLEKAFTEFEWAQETLLAWHQGIAHKART